jgi:chitinase
MRVVHVPEAGKLIASRVTNHRPGLPKHILIGYWHNWHNHAAPFVRLRDIAPHFDVINIAFAVPSRAANGEIAFVPHILTEEFKADVTHLQSLGRKVLISIGGAAGSMVIDDIAARHNFVDSVTAIIREYNFDGMDINLEGKIILDPGDTDFRKPTSPAIVHLIMAIREIRNNFDSDFILSMAPETVNVQAAFTTYSGLSGSYLPLIHDLRDILTWLQVQHYNSNALRGLDGENHLPGTTDFQIAMADMLLKGFPVQGNPQHIFPPIKPEQLVMGLAAFPDAVNNGYLAPDQFQKVFNDLTNAGKSAALRGVMTWSINWDSANHHQFSDSLGTYLHSLT